MREKKIMAILIWILGCCFGLICLPGRCAPLLFVCLFVLFEFGLVWLLIVDILFPSEGKLSWAASHEFSVLCNSINASDM